MYRIELAFGHCQQSGEPLSPESIAAVERQALRVLSQAFGGGQMHRLTGGYLTAEGNVVAEPSTVLSSHVADIDGHLATLWALAAGEIAVALDQEDVLLVVERVDGMVHRAKPVQPLPIPLKQLHLLETG